MKHPVNDVNFDHKTFLKFHNALKVILIALLLTVSHCTKKPTEEKDPSSELKDGDILDVIGEGDITVFKGDIHGDWVNGKYDISVDAHGNRTTRTFQQYVAKNSYTLYEIEGGLDDVIDIVLPQKLSPSMPTSIISSSAGNAEVFGDIPDRFKQTVQTLLDYNVLLIGSLENNGVSGRTEEDGTKVSRQHPHGPTNTAIAMAENKEELLKKTIYVGVINRSGNGMIDLKDFDLFETHTVFVKMNKSQGDISESTSHATPKLAALAVNILAKNKNLTAAELKLAILERCKKQPLYIEDSEYDHGTGEYTDDSQERNVLVLNADVFTLN